MFFFKLAHFSDGPTDRQTDIMVHKEVTLPIQKIKFSNFHEKSEIKKRTICIQRCVVLASNFSIIENLVL